METGDSKAVITIEGLACLDSCAELYESFKNALEEQDHVMVNLSKAEDFDIAAIQILYAAVKEAQERCKKLSFVGSIPDRVAVSLKRMGFLSEVVTSAEDFERNFVGLAGSTGREVHRA